MYDIVSVGELLIDFTPARNSNCINPVFEQNPGGAPANLAVAAAKQGGSVAFIGKVGDDQFGRALVRVLRENGVDTRGVAVSPAHHTSLAFVKLGEDGQNEYTFIRDADKALSPGDVDWDIIADTRLLHVSSLAFCGELTAQTTYEMIGRAKASGALVSYDANWRPMLWEDKTAGLESLRIGLLYADIVKTSEEELALLTGEADERVAARNLLNTGDVKLVAVTKGEAGSTLHTRDTSVSCPTHSAGNAVDTTGAGDAFFGAFLLGLLRENSDIGALSEAHLLAIQRFANTVAGLSVTRRGGISSMPTSEEVAAQ